LSKNWVNLVFLVFFLLSPLAPWAQKKTELDGPEKKVQAERLFLEGLQFFWTDRPADALKAWEEVIRLDPNQATTHYFIGKTQASLNQWELAKQSFEKALKLAPENKYIPEEYGQALIRLGNLKEAIAIFERLVRDQPANPLYYYTLADLWRQENKPQEVLRVIAQLEKVIGVTEETTRQKQLIYLQQNQVDKIFQASDALIASEPKEIEFVLQKAQMQMAANRWEEATQTLQKLIEQHPTASKAYGLLISVLVIQEDYATLTRWTRKMLPQRTISLSEVAPLLKQTIASKKIEESAALYALLVTRLESGSPAADEWGLAGFWALTLEKWTDAQTFLKKSIELDPNDQGNWQALLEANRLSGAFDQLVTNADQATTYFPAEPAFWYHLGLGLYYQKKLQDARDALEECTRIPTSSVPLKAFTQALLGDVYHAMKKFAQSDQAYEAALELDPTLPQALNNFSYFSALRKENLDKAAQRAKKLVELYPNVSGYLDTYAWVLAQQGKWNEALPLLEKAVAQSEGVSATIWEHLGDVYAQLGMPDKAKSAWQKARELGGGTPQLDQKLAQ